MIATKVESGAPDVYSFVHGLAYAALPGDVVEHARRCLVDLAGVALAGGRTELARIAARFAARAFGTHERGARILQDGRRVGLPGAAYAGAAAIDSYDAHEGHALTKGHAGVVLLPALLALDDGIAPLAPREFITLLVLGYEVATRAGIALHRSAAEYHTSGAWNALAVALIAARVLRLDRTQTRHAVGIAEYHGPRSLMLRGVDHPTMVKDGSAWGALAGMSAALLAQDGFTGAPATTIEEPGLADLWTDLGTRWRIREQYFKPHPVCRWAQPAIEAALAVMRDCGVALDAVSAIEVETFAEGVRLAHPAPATTEEAQYSLPFAVACALVHGRIGLDAIDGPGLRDPRVLRVSRAVRMVDHAPFSQRFPAERWARVRLLLADGRRVESDATPARGDPDAPLDDAEVDAKFLSCASPALGEAHARTLLATLRTYDTRDGTAARDACNLLLDAPRARPPS